MWSLLRIVIVSLAFVGFLGQTEARATPISIASSTQMMSDCAEMVMGAMEAATPQKQAPCQDMTPDCIAKMGCATVSPLIALGPSLERAVPGPSPTYDGATHRLTGVTTTPPRDPPKL